jgi:hypothetical protein
LQKEWSVASWRQERQGSQAVAPFGEVEKVCQETNEALELALVGSANVGRWVCAANYRDSKKYARFLLEF